MDYPCGTRLLHCQTQEVRITGSVSVINFIRVDERYQLGEIRVTDRLKDLCERGDLTCAGARALPITTSDTIR